MKLNAELSAKHINGESDHSISLYRTHEIKWGTSANLLYLHYWCTGDTMVLH